jgi:hypothetical protein
MSKIIKHDRRSFLGTATTIIAAALLGMLRSADAQIGNTNGADAATNNAGIRTFSVHVP